MESIPYLERSAYLAKNLGLNENMILKMVTGDQPGQILLNYDECSNEQDITAWKHLFDLDYKMIFNP